jgi:hypothetical protein
MRCEAYSHAGSSAKTRETGPADDGLVDRTAFSAVYFRLNDRVDAGKHIYEKAVIPACGCAVTLSSFQLPGRNWIKLHREICNFSVSKKIET